MLVVVAGVTLVLVLAQFVLISEQSAVYVVQEEEPMQLEAPKAGQGTNTLVFEQPKTLPVVLMHGMGDAARNGGMLRIQKVRVVIGSSRFCCVAVVLVGESTVSALFVVCRRQLQSVLELMW